MGYPALQSGYTMSPRGVAAFFTTFLVGRLVGKIPLRWMLGFGFSMLALSSYMLSGINLQVSMASVIFPTVLNGVAISFIFVPLTTATMSQLKQREIGSGTGLYNLMLNIGGSIGIALVTTLVVRGAQTHQALMVGHLTPTDPVFTQRLAAAQHALAQHTDPVTASHQGYGLIYGTLNAQAHLWAFVDTFRIFGLMVLCCLPLILLFKRVKHAPVRQVSIE
jgi:DHA2 family multidrug resistance protein